MAVLTDKNLADYNTHLIALREQVAAWTNYLAEAEKSLTGEVASSFKTNYAKGKKATQLIQDIIDILQSLRKDLNQLIEDANTFYTTSYNASKK